MKLVWIFAFTAMFWAGVFLSLTCGTDTVILQSAEVISGWAQTSLCLELEKESDISIAKFQSRDWFYLQCEDKVVFLFYWLFAIIQRRWSPGNSIHSSSCPRKCQIACKVLFYRLKTICLKSFSGSLFCRNSNIAHFLHSLPFRNAWILNKML